MLDDEAATRSPTAGQIASPAPTGRRTSSPATRSPPAPTPSGLVPLSAFDGGTPNGTWKLYVMDDLGGDSGELLAWSLIFFFFLPPPHCPVGSTEVTIGDNFFNPYTVNISAGSRPCAGGTSTRLPTPPPPTPVSSTQDR